jgi:hypothetical protein
MKRNTSLAADDASAPKPHLWPRKETFSMGRLSIRSKAFILALAVALPATFMANPAQAGSYAWAGSYQSYAACLVQANYYVYSVGAQSAKCIKGLHEDGQYWYDLLVYWP